jgi:hypothetical protein
MSKAIIKVTQEIDLFDIKINDKSIGEILDEINGNLDQFLIEFSRLKEKYNIEDFDDRDIDSPIHGIMNLIEEL